MGVTEVYEIREEVQWCLLFCLGQFVVHLFTFFLAVRPLDLRAPLFGGMCRPPHAPQPLPCPPGQLVMGGSGRHRRFLFWFGAWKTRFVHLRRDRVKDDGVQTDAGHVTCPHCDPD